MYLLKLCHTLYYYLAVCRLNLIYDSVALFICPVEPFVLLSVFAGSIFIVVNREEFSQQKNICKANSLSEI